MDIAFETRFTLSVLVVDDDEDTANSLATLLAMKGYQSRPAFSAQEALLAAAADQPDVVILDLLMPGMNGWELAHRLRDQASQKQPLLVAVSGCWADNDRWRSADAGIDLHLVKPVEPALLVGLLKRFARVLAPCQSNFPPPPLTIHGVRDDRCLSPRNRTAHCGYLSLTTMRTRVSRW